jgi:hypothetical protein
MAAVNGGTSNECWRQGAARLIAGLCLSIVLAPSVALAARAQDPVAVPPPAPATRPHEAPRDPPHAAVPILPTAPVWYGPCGTVILSILLAVVQLAKKFYRFLGLGIYLNWIAAAFLLLAGVVSFMLHQAAAPSLGGFTKLGPVPPVVSSLAANFIGAMVYGFGRERKKARDLGAHVEGLLFQLIQDRIRTRNGIAMDRLARETDFQLIRIACQRLIDDDIPFRAIPIEKRDAIQEALSRGEREPAANGDEALRQKHRLLLSVVEVTSFKEVQAALRRAVAAEMAGGPPASRPSPGGVAMPGVVGP